MPIGPMTCIKCSAEMIEGFIPEPPLFGRPHQVWVEGPVQRGFFGVKTDERDVRRVRAYRCIVCGYLESYATEPAR